MCGCDPGRRRMRVYPWSSLASEHVCAVFANREALRRSTSSHRGEGLCGAWRGIGG